MENFGKFMAIVLILIINPIVGGFVLSKLWLWFIVPIFQMEPLRVVEAIGILLIIGFLKFKRDKVEEALNQNFWAALGEDFIYALLTAGMFFLFGWIVSCFL